MSLFTANIRPQFAVFSLQYFEPLLLALTSSDIIFFPIIKIFSIIRVRIQGVLIMHKIVGNISEFKI